MKKIFFLIILLIMGSVNSNPLLQKPKILSEQDITKLANEWKVEFVWSFYKFIKLTCCHEKNHSTFNLSCLGLPIIRNYNFRPINKDGCSQNYYFEEPLKIKNASPIKLNCIELGNFLKNKKFIFYTGAGLSATKVPTMKILMQSLNLDSFFKFFKQKLNSITDAFSNFCNAAIYSSPTEAHYAIHQISQSREIQIITENIDLLQHRTGSEPIFAYSTQLHSVTDDELKDVDVLVCVGMSHDDRGFIAHFKKKNRKGTIVAINLEIPNYLTDKDVIVKEDIQSALPSLANYLSKQ